MAGGAARHLTPETNVVTQEEELIGQASRAILWCSRSGERERDAERSLVIQVLNVTCHTCGTMRK